MIEKYRSSPSQMFFKISALKNFTGKQICWNLVLLKLQTFRRASLIKRVFKKVLTCEIYEIFNKTFFYRTPPVAASESKINIILQTIKCLLIYRVEFNRFMNLPGNLGTIK